MALFGFARVLLIAATALAFTSAPARHQGPPQVQAGVRYICLIRHGQYDHDDTTDSRTGKHLVALGHEQARLIGERLATLPVEIATFVSSEYTRARETGDDIGGLIGRTPERDSLDAHGIGGPAAPTYSPPTHPLMLFMEAIMSGEADPTVQWILARRGGWREAHGADGGVQ